MLTHQNVQEAKPSPKERLRGGITELLLFVAVIIGTLWVSQRLETSEPTVWIVLVAAGITAVTTGYGALPFLFFQNISKRWLGIGNALASGLMLGASVGLLIEGATLEDAHQSIVRLSIGTILGLLLVFVSQRLLADRDADFQIGQAKGVDAIQMLLIMGVMTVHSFAEGVGVGVSYAGENSFGLLITIAIAIHNIPEGLAISLVLIPRGMSVSRAAWLSVFSSVPQPIMAGPAFLFVTVFRPLLPVGLGLAAGAMFYMVFRELLPDALENMAPRAVYPATVLAAMGMLLFQFLIG
ncbi:MAG: ZIP family metal transporter [Anaerolineae bacterium]|nr:ZIP family metal transporter [Anaerolineae bacterium]